MLHGSIFSGTTASSKVERTRRPPRSSACGAPSPCAAPWGWGTFRVGGRPSLRRSPRMRSHSAYRAPPNAQPVGLRGLATAFRLRRIWPLGSPRLKPCGPQLASFRKFGPGRRNIRKAVVCETKPFKKALALSALQRLQSEVPFRWSCDGSSAEPLRISLCRRRRHLDRGRPAHSPKQRGNGARSGGRRVQHADLRPRR